MVRGRTDVRLKRYSREQPYKSLLNKEDHGVYIHKITVINEDDLLNIHKEN